VALARRLAQEVARRAPDADRKGALPEEDIAALERSGYLALSVPKAYGGAGASLGACTEAQLELAKGSTSTALVAAMQLHLFGHALETGSWGDLMEEFCERAAQGELFNSAASEPTLGSPSRGGLPQTEAVRDGDDLVITGQKTWVTGGEHLDHLLVRVALEGRAATVWVPDGLPGVRWERTWGGSLSLRASDSHDVHFEGVRVPASHRLPEAPGGPNLWFPTLVTATYLGTALAARDAAVRYALARVPTALGRPIATLPKIQRQLGEMETALSAAKTLLLETAHTWTGGDPAAHFPRVVAAKHVATETALTVTETALRLVGGASMAADLPFERFFRDVRAGLMHPPSGDAALELVGRSALGL